MGGAFCARCGRRQPPGQWATTCVHCGYPLPVTRWVAHPPAGAPRGPRTVRRRPYAGPPTYRGRPPTWGFPTVAWRRATVSNSDGVAEPSRFLLRLAGWLAVLTALACLAGTVAEFLRWMLMLRGRTEVLPASAVAASDLFVTVAAAVAASAAVVTVVVAVPVLVRTHRAAERRIGYGASRPSAAVLARLIVPGWNLYGAGQVLAEIDGRLDNPDGATADADRPRPGRLVIVWWCAWVVNGLLVLITMARAFGGSLQAVADTVELHIAVNAAATVVAALSAAVLWRFARLLGRPDPLTGGWRVAPPAPTRGGQPSTVSTAPARDDIGASSDQATAAARSSGAQPEPAAGPAATVVTPIPSGASSLASP